MNKNIRVLVFPCGAENAVEIHTALKDVVNIELYGASSRDDHGQFIFKNYFGDIPFITDLNFIKKFNQILVDNNIDIVIPTHDDISLYLAENSQNLYAKIAVPGLKQAQISRSKKLTYNLLKKERFCPVVYNNLNSIVNFPCFCKPDKGQGGKGAFVINNQKDLKTLDHARLKDYVITEYLPGEELTVDCFTDKNNELKFIGPRKRNRVFGGISVNSSVVPVDNEIKQIAKTISDKVSMRGLWFFQLKKNIVGKYKLLEISVRTAGTMNLYRGLGVNFPLLTVYDLLNYDVNIIQNDYYLEVDRALFNRYKSSLKYDSIYIDFDDTITKNNKVNPFVMQFIYHAINSNKKIYLITKHIHDINKTLIKLKINSSLFDNIILLKPDDQKYKAIDLVNNPIFIDNAYAERYEVKKHLNIPVFDIDAINTLIDWRE